MGYKASAFTETASSYVKADDVRQGPQKFVIESVEVAEFKDGTSSLQLLLAGGKKLTLNKTNARVLAAILGDDTDAWIGKKIVASFDPTVMYQGKAVGGLRVKPVMPKPPTPPPVEGDDDSDDIPF